MAENTPDDRTNTATPAGPQHRPARVFQALLALAALVLAGWGLAGGPAIDNLALIGWIAVAVALTTGISLVVTNIRR